MLFGLFNNVEILVLLNLSVDFS